MKVDRRSLLRGAAAIAIVASGAGAYALYQSGPPIAAAGAAPAEQSAPPAAGGPPTLELSAKQLELLKLARVATQSFPVEREAVGSIDFDEDVAVQVFTPYQGKIIQAFAKLGDEVVKGKPLYTIDSPDLVQAESTLIGAAATYDLNARALARAKSLYDRQGNGGIAEKDLDQAVSDEKTAEGALKAARDAVRVFGKTEAEIDSIVSSRKIDSALVVPSPSNGRVTARNAQPGLFVQPGNTPAPYTVADISTMWMIANVPESDSALYHLGQAVKVSLIAYPGQEFEGKISTIGASVDPNLHTLLIRSEIADPKHQLLPGMLANFVIDTGSPVEAPAIALNGVVRLGDGTMTAWVTTDQHHFAQRVIKVGLQHGDFDQVLDGLQPGETVVSDGAVYLDNMLNAPATD
jgi:cobalt-zinc-cadmium efflux system membrane fusion protein